ncbi:ComEC/Rec2 family competence protein [Psychrobacter lutiphocae]|uniref:ComEC/Rec2 family competence protein n=1 Tax=Psychrobacter lutiphocae TaxID=540500 RepID=UPI0012EAFF72|nr:ComEC/Rec2 family competence protein [Psychrobacter lutiphocae]
MALAIVLAVLQLTPMQLTAISLGVSGERWQLAAYWLLAGWVLLWLLPYAFRWLDKRRFSQPLSSQQRSRKLLFGLYRLAMLAIFWLAVLINSTAQRMVAIEQSVRKVLFVEANVRPVGLSDRRLAFESDTSSKPKLQQGYRQLVTLSDIQPYTEQKNSTELTKVTAKNSASSRVDKQQRQHNPLAVDTSALKTKLASDGTRQKHSIADYQLPATMTVMLSAYQAQLMALNDFASDQQLKMQLQLSPVELLDKNSEDEFDEYRWLSSRHATAKAKVLAVDFDSLQQRPSSLQLWIDRQRFELRQHFLQLLEAPTTHIAQNNASQKGNASQSSLEFSYTNQKILDKDSQQRHTQMAVAIDTADTDAVAVTLSLLTGDRSLISPQMTDLYRFAGISHLLAISGTHVLFLAMLCAGLVTMLITRFAPSFYQLVPRWQCAFVISVIAAFGYALFAGFDVPAVRTACMLLVVGVLRYLLASASVFKVLLLLAVAMVWVDIFVLWQAGFWLSFIAVAVLVVYSLRWEQGGQQPLVTPSRESLLIWERLRRAAFDLFKLQLWMSIALLPVSLWLFGQVSLWGFVVNLFAIGLFGWVIVPINLLAGVLYAAFPNHPQVADKLWSALFWLLDSLHHTLFALQHSWQQAGWIYAKPSLVVLLLLLLASLPWILPKGIFSRLLSVPPLLVIAVLGITHIQQRQNMLHIQVITPVKQDKKTPLSAALVWYQQQAWLLLSAYPKTTSYPKTSNQPKPTSFITSSLDQVSAYNQNENQNKNTSPQALWSAQQQQILIQSLYDQIKQQQVNHLTGIIVQTATPQMASMVAQFTQLMPVSYYWQAGLIDNRPYVETQLAGSAMTAQSCHFGRRWQAGEAFKLSVETGWDEVASASVWDCAIGLTTSAEVQLPASMQLAIATTANTKMATTAGGRQVESIESVESIEHKPQQFLFYSSNQPQLADLWQLMCAADVATTNASARSPTVTDTATSTASSASTALPNNVEQLPRRHWLISSQASIDKALVTSRQPLSWHILDSQQLPANLKLKETQLYWQQSTGNKQ